MALEILTRPRHYRAQTVATETTRALNAVFCLRGGNEHARKNPAFFSSVLGPASPHVPTGDTPGTRALAPLATL